MLTPQEINKLPSSIVDLYDEMEHSIIKTIARHLKNSKGKLSDSSAYSYYLAKELAKLNSEIKTQCKTVHSKIEQQTFLTCKTAIEQAVKNDAKYSGLSKLNFSSKIQEEHLTRLVKKTQGDLRKVTNSVYNAGCGEFNKVVNQAFLQVSSGFYSYQDAMKEAADTLARDGIRILTHTKGEDTRYAPHGKPPATPPDDVISKRSVESVVRANIITSINSEAASVTLDNCRELECDLVEVSEHVGARPEHEAWQGKVYSISGESKKYPPFSVCGYGEADGICGINCRHSFYPYFEEELTEGEKAELDRLHESIEEGNKEVYTYKHIVNGEEREEHCSRYEAEQVKRGLERKVREWKRREDIKEVLDVDATREKAKVRQWKKKLYTFEEQTGLDSIADKGRLKIGEGEKERIQDAPIILPYDKSNAQDIDIKLVNTQKEDKRLKEFYGGEKSFYFADNGVVNSFSDIKEGINKGYFYNCQSCVPVFIARLKGYDIKALPFNRNNEYMMAIAKNNNLAFIDEKNNAPPYIDINVKNSNNMKEILNKTIRKKDIYSFEYSYMQDNIVKRHTVILTRDKNNRLTIYDPQVNRYYYNDNTVKEYLDNIEYSRGNKLLKLNSVKLNTNIIKNISEASK